MSARSVAQISLAALVVSTVAIVTALLLPAPPTPAAAANTDAAAKRIAWAEYQTEKAYKLIELTYGVKISTLEYWRTPVTVSAYTARAVECNSSPHVTADMTPSRIGLLAVSRDMLDEVGLRMGDTVLLVDGLETLGVFQVRDKMAKRWRRRVDILHGNVEAAKTFGIRKGVQLVKVVSNG